MANPADPGTFDLWITDRIMFNTAVPKSGDTGDFDLWITDREYWLDYVEAVEGGVTLEISRTPSDLSGWKQGVKIVN